MLYIIRHPTTTAPPCKNFEGHAALGYPHTTSQFRADMLSQNVVTTTKWYQM
jgi:hypothetical protein